MSLAKAARRGLEASFKDEECTIKNEKVFIRAMNRSNNTYVLQATSKLVTKETARVSEDKTGSYGIWHQRIGHLHRNGVEKLLSSLNIGVHDAGVPTCPTCVSGKLAQKPFKTRHHGS